MTIGWGLWWLFWIGIGLVIATCNTEGYQRVLDSRFVRPVERAWWVIRDGIASGMHAAIRPLARLVTR